MNDALAPPDRMKLPSFTARTRSSAGSKVSVSVIVESRETFVIEIGTVYGPAPTLNAVPGGVRSTCAAPSPGELILAVSPVGGGVACAGGAAGGAAG